MAEENAQKSQLSDEQVHGLLKESIAPEGQETEREPAATEDSKPRITMEEEPGAGVETQETVPAEPEVVDDVESLKTRLAERETELSRKDEMMKAIQTSAAQQVQWGKDGFLRKSTEFDQFKSRIREMAATGEMDQKELERLLAGVAQDQQQAQQAPLQSQPLFAGQQQQPVAPDPDAAQDEFNFRSDNPELWDEKTYTDFVQFVQAPDSGIVQTDIVTGNNYATLARIYSRFNGRRSDENNVKAKAVKSVQRAQKQAIRAAGAVSAKASPAPPADEAVDFSKMTPQEERDSGHVDKWLQEIMANR